MDGNDFGKQITQAARMVARIELRRRKMRKQLAELDDAYSAAQRDLRLLVQSVQPFSPTDPALAREANDAIDGRI